MGIVVIVFGCLAFVDRNVDQICELCFGMLKAMDVKEKVNCFFFSFSSSSLYFLFSYISRGSILYLVNVAETPC